MANKYERSPAGGIQDRLATLLGCEPDARAGVVARMLHRSPVEATGYWLQLVVAAGIATLGLVLGSTAVVIGAMLVAPLMGPIVSLGMGLAVGSPFLVLRGGIRVVLSIALVVAFATGVTRMLPFHAINAEIAARTTPTALDLATAAFCAVAGVYAAMRPASDVATTAAGTSIGISLVPPLCVVGYGLGTSSWNVAYGAGLLFSTNYVAIVTVGSAAFAAAGFGRVDVAAIERDDAEESGEGGLVRAAARRLSALFASRGGPWLRILMPIVLLGAVYVPLRHGLDEVAWQIRARAVVEQTIASLPGRVVESRVRVERGEIDLDLFLLGGRADADVARKRLTEAIRPVARSAPRIDVQAVTDAGEFEALEQSLRKPAPTAVVETAPPPPPRSAVDVLADATSALEKRWPSTSAGAPLRVDATLVDGRLEIAVLHLGAPVEPATIEAVEGALFDDLGADVTLRAAAIPADPMVPSLDEPTSFAALAVALERVRRAPSVRICLSVPATEKGRPESAPARKLRTAVAALVGEGPRVTRSEGPLAVWFADGAC
jgi:uncharacterized hydrophobic protein (TIGR00271 family)